MPFVTIMIGKVRSNIHDCNADFGAGAGFAEFFPGKAIEVVSEGDFFDHILAVKGRSVQKERNKMAQSEAGKRACKKYQAQLKGFHIKLKPEQLNRYKEAAARKGMTFRSFVLNAIEKAMSD